MKGKYRKAIFCVVYTKKRDKILYLLLKRKMHWVGWEFPKGGIEKGDFKRKLKPQETIGVLGTVKREVKEETGQNIFNIKKYKFSGKFRYKKIYQDRPGLIGQTYKLFSAEVNNKKIKVDKNEHTGYTWLTFDKAIKKLTHNNQKKALKIVDKTLK